MDAPERDRRGIPLMDEQSESDHHTFGAVETDADFDRLRRRLEDTTLQALEFIAAGGRVGSGADLEELMRLAAREATQLRDCLEQIVSDDDRPLEDGLRHVVDHARCLAEPRIDLVLGPTDGSVTGLAAVDLVAAVREALTNVQRHADAGLVTVYAEEQNGEALVTVNDDGIGVDPDELHPRLGMRHSIEKRLSQVGGSATFESLPGRGVLVTLRARAAERKEPLRPAESE